MLLDCNLKSQNFQQNPGIYILLLLANGGGEMELTTRTVVTVQLPAS